MASQCGGKGGSAWGSGDERSVSSDLARAIYFGLLPKQQPEATVCTLESGTAGYARV